MQPTEIHIAGLKRCSRKALLGATALRAAALVVLATPATAQLAPTAHPTGGVVTQGQAGIAQNGNTTLINQASQSAAINWQNFNVGSQATVQFNQPNSNAIALNRVTGPDPSEIAGHITANGQLVIVNQSGVIFDQGSQVDSAGLVVSASGITDQNFAHGKMLFDQAPHPGARVVNNGTITIRQAGLAALVAPQVSNNGLIRAQLGRVILAGAAAYTLDLYGDGLLALNVTSQVTNVNIGGRSLPALVTNSGTILADGGTILLTAQAADGLIRTLVNAGGTIAAQTVGNKQGRILAQGIGGSVEIDGALSASGNAPGTAGGQVVANATGSVNVESGASIDASGSAGGGLIAIGTTAARAAGGPGARSTLTARAVNLAAGAHLSANATARGHGGQITLLSTGLTSAAGAITVLGGAQGGDGGNIEISGATVGLSGLTDARAAQGRTGSLLIDPASLIIADVSPNSDHIGTNTYLSTAVLSADLLTANVTMTAAGDIDFAYHNGSANLLNTHTHVLDLTAGQGVNIDSGFQITGTGGVNLTAKTGGITFDTSTGITFGLGNGVTTPAQLMEATLNLKAAGSIAIGTATIGGSQSITLAAGNANVFGDISGAGILATPSLTATAEDGILLSGLTGTPTNLGHIAAAFGNITIDSTQALTTSGNITAFTGNIYLSASSLQIGSILTAFGGAAGAIGPSPKTPTFLGYVGLTANAGGVIETGLGHIQAGAVFGGASGGTPTAPARVDLEGSNLFGTLNSLSATADVRIIDRQALMIFGSVSGGTLVSITAPSISLGGEGAGISGTNLITLRADSFALNAPVTTPSTGTVALDLYTAGGTLQAGGVASAFGSLGLVSISTGTLALGSDDGITDSGHVGSLSINGAFNVLKIAPNLGLFANGAVTAPGIVTAGTLFGGGASFTLNGANQILNLGNVTAQTIDITDARPLDVTGTVTGYTSDTLASTGLLTINGAAGGGIVSLSGTALAIRGTAFGDGSLALDATQGNIIETGTLTATLLTGSATGTASLSGRNNVALLGDFTAAGFALNDTNLSVSGHVDGHGSVVISNSGSLGVEVGTGSITGSVTRLSGTSIFINGSVNAAGLLTLDATAGDILAIGGSIDTALLNGSATGAAALSGTNNIATIGNFSAAGFTLHDTPDLRIVGMLNGGASVDVTETGTLTLATGAHLAGAATSLTAGALVLNGTVTAANSLGLEATAGAITAAGSLTSALLSGHAATSALFDGTNSIGAIGDFTAASFIFAEAGNLDLTGLVGTGTFTSLASGGVLTVSGHVAGAETSLRGADLVIDGTALGSAGLTLTATTGSITEAGTLNTALLTGSAFGSARLTGTNLVTGLGGFSATGFALDDTEVLEVSGSVAGRSSAQIKDTAAVTVAAAGSIGAQTVSLTGAFLTLDGSVAAPTSITLSATAGTIAAPGTLTTALLTGGAARGADLEGANTITDLGNFTAHGFTFAQAGSLDVTGTVDGGPSASIASSGVLTIDGSVAALATNLKAGDLAIPGAATGTNSLTLTAVRDTITETGSLATASLSGSASGSASLTGHNSIASLAAFSANGLTLANTTDLNVAGLVTAGPALTITDAGNLLLSVAGSLSSGSIALTGAAVGLNGASTAGTLISLTSTIGAINEAGSLTTPTLAVSAKTSAALTGNNASTTLASSSAGADFTLFDSATLTVAGDIAVGTGARLYLRAPTLQAIQGSVLSAPGGVVALQSDAFLLAGSVTTGATGAIALDPLTSGGTLALSGIDPAGFTTAELALGSLNGSTSANNVQAIHVDAALDLTGHAGTLALFTTATGTITQTASLAAGTLTGSAGTVTLTNAANNLTSIGNFAASNFTYAQNSDLAVAGTVRGSTFASIASGGLLTIGGAVIAPSVNLTGANLAIPGTASAAGTLTLAATSGSITESGRLNAGVLTGTATAAALLTGANHIADLAAFTAAGLTLNDAAALTLTAQANGGTATTITDAARLIIGTDSLITGDATALQATSITINGGIAAATSLSLIATSGAITEASPIIGITTARLTGSAQGAASLTGQNRIASVGNFSADGITLQTAGDLNVTGLVSGNSFVDIAQVNALTVAAAAGITANRVVLASESIDVLGSVTAPASLALDAVSGITAPGTITTGLLTGTGTLVDLTGSNHITDLGNFTALQMTVAQAGNLDVTGAVDGGTGAAIRSGATLTVSGSVTASSIDLTGASLNLPGSVAGSTNVSLTATGGTITQTGALSTGRLDGSATGTAAFIGHNTIAALDQFTAQSLILHDLSDLQLTGFVQATDQATILDSGTFSLTGKLAAPITRLTGAALAIDGVITAPTSAELTATAGAITEHLGGIQTGLLAGSATGSVLLAGSNRITDLGAFSANGFTLDTGPNLTVTNDVNGGTLASISVSQGSMLTVAASVTASATSLSANDIAIPGAITGTNSLTLTAGSNITGTGTITTALLTGSAGFNVALSGSNQIAALGNFTAQNFALNDARDLAATGTLATTGNTRLTASSLAIVGSLDAANVLTLNTTKGGITEAGSITAALLTGSASASASLTGTNSIANLGSFTASGLSLIDNRNLAVTGNVSGGSLASLQTVGTLTVEGSVTAAATALIADDLVIPGAATGTDSLTLTAFGGSIASTGTLTTGTLTGLAKNLAVLSGPNQITTLGNFTAQGLVLTDVPNLAVTGAVKGTVVEIKDSGTLTIAKSGSITAGRALLYAGAITEAGHLTADLLIGSATGSASFLGANAITDLSNFTAQNFTFRQAGDLTVTGIVTVGTLASITDGGLLTVQGSIDAPAIALTAADIGETGHLITELLTGSATGSALLTGTNQIAGLGNFSAAGLGINDGPDLGITGAVNGHAALAITDAGTLTVATSGSLFGSVTSLTATAIAIDGAIVAPTSLALTATAGGITETGSIATALLTGSATGTASFAGNNSIGALGSFTAAAFTLTQTGSLVISGALDGGQSLALTSLAALTIDGSVTAATTALTGASLSIAGSATGTNSLALTATKGTINATGTLTTAALSGSATGSASLSGTNQIASLANFTAAGFLLNDTPNLAITGAVNGHASAILIDAGTLTLNAAGSITANTTRLTAADLALFGTVDAPTALDLAATTGAILSQGSLNTALLTGTATGTASLLNTGSITALGNFAAGGLLYSQSGDLIVSGHADGGLSTGLFSSGRLTVTGTVLGAHTELDAANLVIPGTVSGSSFLQLVATGAITAPGQVDSASLNLSAGGTASFSGSNLIASLGDSSVASLVLKDGEDLAVIGGVDARASASITDAGTLTIATTGLLNGTTTALTANAMEIDGEITAPTSLALTTTLGGIYEPANGIIVTPLLTGRSAGAATFDGKNDIGHFGPFISNGLTLIGSGNLILTGAIDGGETAFIATNGSLTVEGSLTAARTTLEGQNLSVPGSVTGSQTLDLIANGGPIIETGSLTAHVLSSSNSGGALLTGSNRIVALDNFTAYSLSLKDGQDLLVAGLNNFATTLAIEDAGTLTVSAGQALIADRTRLQAEAIIAPGTIAGTTALSLIATQGAIDSTGTVDTRLLIGHAATSAHFLGNNNNVTDIGNFAAADFAFFQSGDLHVTGPVGGGTLASVASFGQLTINGTVTAAATSLAGHSIAIPGTAAGSKSLTLTATGGNITEGGTLDTAALSGSATLQAVLTGTNHIATLLAFNAAGLTLSDADNLAILGAVNGGGHVSLNDAGTLTLAKSGTLAGSATDIKAAAIALDGTLGATDLSVDATAGFITETGGITANLLTGSAATNASFTGTNSIANLGAFTAHNLVLDDTTALTIAGAVTAEGNAMFNTGALTVANTLTAATATLNAPAITIRGTIAASRALTLNASDGAIHESGSIDTALLTGTANAIAAFNGTNQIAAVGDFTAGGLIINDTGDLRLTGHIHAGPYFIITDAGTLTLATGASLAATQGRLTADGMIIAGAVATPGTLTLTATKSGINEPGAIAAGTLQGTARTSATLAGSNRIATLAGFTSQNFTLADQASLTVAGPVAAASTASITDAGSLTLAGTITAPTVSLTGAAIDIAGAANAATSLSLTATSGGITEEGSIATALLTGSATGATSLTGTNQIATLGTFATDGLTLIDQGALAIAGPVNAGPAASITAGGALSLPGSLTASATLLNAQSIDVAGGIDAATSLTLTARKGGITAAGQIATALLTGSATGDASLTGNNNQIATLGAFTASNLTLADAAALAIAGPVTTGQFTLSGTAITETGNITAATLAGTATGAATFDGANQIATLGDFTAASFNLTDVPALAVTGHVSAQTIGLTAESLNIPGTLTAPGALNVIASDAITETGAVQTALLTGQAGGATQLTGQNSIAALGDFSTSGLVLNDAGALSIDGNVQAGATATLNIGGSLQLPGGLSAGTGVLTATDIGIAGALTGTSALALTATQGSIAGSGQLTTPRLSLSASNGGIALSGANRIATLASATAQADITLNNEAALSITGSLASQAGSLTVSAAAIALSGTAASPGRITLLAPDTITLDGGTLDAPTILIGEATEAPAQAIFNGGTIITGTSPGASAAKPTFPRTDGSVPGLFVRAGAFTQTGTTLINPQGGPATVFITLANRGSTVAFDPNAGQGLNAPASALFLDLNANGSAIGQVTVASLNVTYVPPAAPTLTNLYGTVGGIGGQDAAGRAYIVPEPDANYRFNACPIESVNCVLLSPIIVPIYNPTENVEIDTDRRRQRDDDLLVPDVGNEEDIGDTPHRRRGEDPLVPNVGEKDF